MALSSGKTTLNWNSSAPGGRPWVAGLFSFSRFAVCWVARRLGRSSLSVLSADRTVISAADIASGQLPPFVDQAFADALWSAQLAAQDELAPNLLGATHITSTNAGHYIHVEQPQIVVEAITQ